MQLQLATPLKFSPPFPALSTVARRLSIVECHTPSRGCIPVRMKLDTRRSAAVRSAHDHRATYAVRRLTATESLRFPAARVDLAARHHGAGVDRNVDRHRQG